MTFCIKQDCPTPEEFDSREAMWGSYWDIGSIAPATQALVKAENDAYLRDHPPTEAEKPRLINNITEMLRIGWWGGYRDPDGEALEYPEASRKAAQAFMYRVSLGMDPLTPEFLQEYGKDIAGELRLGRGWCIHDYSDKHAYGDHPPQTED